MSIPQTIHQALGGDQFLLSTNTRKVAETVISVSYSLPKNRMPANYLVITINSKNLYDMEFYRPEPFDQHPTMLYRDQSLSQLSNLLFRITGLTVNQP